MSNLSDEVLLKRSDHARRNLSVLASLASIGALAMIVGSFFAKEFFVVVLLPGCGIAALAVGYWFLAVAAGRGNPNAVGIVIVAATASIALSLILSGVVAARTGGTFQPNLGGALIPILIIVALNNSRKVLLELKERSLWTQAFGLAKPSAQLLTIGGSLVAAGLLTFNGGVIYIGQKAGQARQSETSSANAFVGLIQSEEKNFMTGLKSFMKARDKEEGKATLLNLDELQQHVQKLQKQAGNNSQMAQILSAYGNALRQWKNGLVILNNPNGVPGESQKFFVLGDKLRMQALADFDRRYAPKH